MQSRYPEVHLDLHCDDVSKLYIYHADVYTIFEQRYIQAIGFTIRFTPSPCRYSYPYISIVKKTNQRSINYSGLLHKFIRKALYTGTNSTLDQSSFTIQCNVYAQSQVWRIFIICRTLAPLIYRPRVKVQIYNVESLTFKVDHFHSFSVMFMYILPQNYLYRNYDPTHCKPFQQIAELNIVISYQLECGAIRTIDLHVFIVTLQSYDERMFVENIIIIGGCLCRS